MRPPDLAMDDTPGIAPVVHALRTLPEKYDWIVLLQPTSPLRTAADIDHCLDQCIDLQADACVSVTRVEKSPQWMYTLDPEAKLHPILPPEPDKWRRQDFTPIYTLNGAVYVAKCSLVLEHETFLTPTTVAYEMPHERSVDIDTELDLVLFEAMLRIRR
jgi:N-acylneuraminate cytidylyltransferase